MDTNQAYMKQWRYLIDISQPQEAMQPPVDLQEREEPVYENY